MLVYFLLKIADIDIKTRQIPDEYSLIICILAVGAGGFGLPRLCLAIGITTLSGLIMGLGDAKLLGALTLLFGTNILSVFLFSFVLAGFYCIVQLFRKELSLHSTIPFAPFIAIPSITYWFQGLLTILRKL